MIKLIAAFGFMVILGLVFHFILGGDSSIKWQQLVIKINLQDLLNGLLLISNLLALIFIVRTKA